MTINEYLRRVKKHIYYIFDWDSIEQELAEHLQDSMEDLRESGYSKEEAEILAVEHMGNPDEVGRQLNKEHHPVFGYAWLLSAVILGFLVVELLFFVGYAAYQGIKTITPMRMENSVAEYPLDMVLELPTHRLYLDNICIDEEGDYYLTYRAQVKYSYSRASWSTELFSVEGSNGKFLRSGGYTSSALWRLYGYLRFEKPEDGMLYVRLRTDKLLEINLDEVMRDE